MPYLAVTSLVAVGWSLVVSALYLRAWLTSEERGAGLGIGASLASIGLLGVVSGLAIIWSDRHEGRGRWVGVIFALLYLGTTLLPPIILVTLHWYGLPALLLLVLALWNVVKWQHEEGVSDAQCK